MSDEKAVIHRCDYQALMRLAANALVALAAEAIDRRGRFMVVLSGGSTPRDLYQVLASAEYRGQLDWKRVEFFWGDERAVSPDQSQSNYRMAKDHLLDPIKVDSAQIHRMEAERDDLESAAEDYAREIARCFDVALTDPPPRFDLILLGLGDDGHTASLFPRTDALGETDRWVVANAVPQLSTDRMTMTIPLINRARAVFFLVAGDNKATALAQVLRGSSDSDPLPAEMIRPTDGRLEWLIDHAAARLVDDD